jgi:tRNA(Ile)-lysidine synthase
MERPKVGSISSAVLYFYPALAPEDLQDRIGMIHTVNGCELSWVANTPTFDLSPTDPAINHLGELMIRQQPIDNIQAKTRSLEFPPRQASDWQFFDGRYWIRVQNLTDRPIFLRPLTKMDLEELLQTDPKGHIDPQDPEASTLERRKCMRLALDTIKPHALRRHLPALFLAPADPEQQPTLLALPTLQSSPKAHGVQDKWECTWDIRYKKIDPGARALSDIVRQPVWHALELDATTQEREGVRRKLDLLLAGKKLQSLEDARLDAVMTSKVRKSRVSKSQMDNETVYHKKDNERRGSEKPSQGQSSVVSKREQGQSNVASKPAQVQTGVVLTDEMRELLKMSSSGRSIGWARQETDPTHENSEAK